MRRGEVTIGVESEITNISRRCDNCGAGVNRQRIGEYEQHWCDMIWFIAGRGPEFPLHVQKGRPRYDRFIVERRPGLPPLLGGRGHGHTLSNPSLGSASDLVFAARVARPVRTARPSRTAGDPSGRPIVSAPRNAAVASFEVGASIRSPNQPLHRSSVTVASAWRHAARSAESSYDRPP
jgi:hypothetical protein